MFKISLQLFIVSILILSCNREENFEFPIVQTGEVMQVDDSSVVFQAKIMNKTSGNEIDHGFVWDTNSDPTLEMGYSKRLGSVKGALFSARIGSYFLSGQEYFVRAYVATPDHLVYGRPVSFISKGGGKIGVSNFYPETGSWGDTISIVHRNISYKKDETKIFFGENLADVVSAHDSVIKVIVPGNLKKSLSQLTINVADTSWVLQDQFSLSPMVIDDFTPKVVSFRDTITILGKNFNPGIEYNNIYLNGEKARVVACSQNFIQVIISDNIKNSDQFSSVKIVVWGFECSINDPLRVRTPVIYNFSLEKADRRDTLVITGQYFNPTPYENKVFIGDTQARVHSSTPTELVTNIPDGVVHGSNKLFVEVANTKVEAENNLFIYEPWKRLNDFPGGPRSRAFSYVADNQAYIGGGNNQISFNLNDLWEYNPGIDRWEKKKTTVYGYMLGFYYKNIIYHIENNLLYKYDPINDSKELISVCTKMDNPHIEMFFVKDDIAYIVDETREEDYLWEYSFINNSWPDAPQRRPVRSFKIDFINGNDVFYIGRDLSLPIPDNNLYKFDFTTKDFMEQLDFKDNEYFKKVIWASVFSIDNYTYIIDGDDVYTTSSVFNRLVRYDKLTNTYIELLNPPFEARAQGIGFSIGRKGYIGLGTNYYKRFSDIWEFDPDKMKPE